MNIDVFDYIVGRIGKVRIIGLDRAKGLCPAHLDKNPSFGVQRTDDRVLIKCWAGCTVENICASLGIKVSDLFFKSVHRKEAYRSFSQKSLMPKISPYQKAKMLKDYAHEFLGFGERFYEHAERVISAAKNISIDTWADHDLENVWAVLDRAYAEIRLVDKLQDLAFELHSSALTMQHHHEHYRRKAA